MSIIYSKLNLRFSDFIQFRVISKDCQVKYQLHCVWRSGDFKSRPMAQHMLIANKNIKMSCFKRNGSF